MVGRLFSSPQAVIPAGATGLSSACYIGGELVAIQTPSAWVAAAMTFQVSYDGVNFFELQDAAGNAITIPSGAVPTSKAIQIALSTSTAAYGTTGPTVSILDFRGALYVKVRSGTSGAPVNQTGGATLTLIVRQHMA